MATLAALALTACGETRQVVGHLKAASTVAPASGARGGAGTGAGASSSTGATDTGTLAPPVKNTNTSAPSNPTASSGGGATPAATPVPGTPCAGVATAATLRQFDMYLMVDTNITLPITNPWDSVAKGLVSYVDNRCANGAGVGVRYFGTDCNPSSYAMPTTVVGVLPDNAAAIKQDMPTTPSTSSPTLPALQGALTYSKSRQNAYPDSKQVVVLLSDGFYDFVCQSANFVQTVFDAVNGIVIGATSTTKTYVVALDAPGLAQVPSFQQLLSPITRFGPLDSIAATGGTGQAHHVDLQADPSAFAQVLVDIQHDAQPCDYAVPDAVRVDPTSMTLGFEDGSGQRMALSRQGSPDTCSGGYAWNDPANPSWATLCPDTCAQLKRACATIVWLQGCPLQ